VPTFSAESHSNTVGHGHPAWVSGVDASIDQHGDVAILAPYVLHRLRITGGVQFVKYVAAPLRSQSKFGIEFFRDEIAGARTILERI